MSQATTPTRRDLFKAAAAGAAAVTLQAGLPAPAAAKAPLATAQAPGYYRRKVGTIEVTALLDGTITFDQATAVALVAKASPEAVAPLNAKYFVPPSGKIVLPISAYVVNTGDKLILVDTGSADKFGPAAGQLPAALAAAGFAPDAVDTVILTHAHPDHAAGLITAKGEAVFPNAELVVMDAETKFWADAATRTRLPDSQKGFVDVAAAALKPYAARTRLIANATDIAPGVSSVALPGHTPGHTGYRISSGNEQLLIIGDAVALYEWLFDKPDWSLAFDVDAAAAVATRKTLFDMVSSDKIMIAGAHLPFPGFGYVGREGAAYRYIPAPWAPL
jgi:glyoxylase-like metal-dependent hydrolase (beta-lactamase superfamily II)